VRISRPRWPLLAAVVAVSVFAVWIVSPRFAIDGPSLVDDWSAISRSPDQLAAVLRFENPESERFRPSWIAWNYVQWHTFDAPQGLAGPNAWNLLRVLVFVIGMSLLTALMLPRANDLRQSVVHAGLAVLPAFTVLAVPKFARDFAWFGPQEPLLLGGLALGGSLLWIAASRLLDDAPVGRLATAAGAAAGSLFWLVGVYQKEVALSAIPLIAAALFVARGRLGRWKELSPARRRALAAIGAVVVLPLVHVAIQAIRITRRGELVYGAEVDGGAGIRRGLEILYDWASEAMPQTARDLMFVTVALVVVASVVRRRVDVLALGALASGLLTIVFAAQSGVAVSRYYIPLLALFAVAASLSLARLPGLISAAGVLVVFFAFMPPTETRAEVRQWSAEEQQHAEIVQLVAELERSGCVVAADGLDLETTLALPQLTSLESTAGERMCSSEAYLVLPPYGSERLALTKTCQEGALEPVLGGRLLGVFACSRLRVGAEAVLAAHRFRSAADA
jgi:hypothetical protein